MKLSSFRFDSLFRISFIFQVIVLSVWGLACSSKYEPCKGRQTHDFEICDKDTALLMYCRALTRLREKLQEPKEAFSDVPRDSDILFEVSNKIAPAYPEVITYEWVKFRLKKEYPRQNMSIYQKEEEYLKELGAQFPSHPEINDQLILLSDCPESVWKVRFTNVNGNYLMVYFFRELPLDEWWGDGYEPFVDRGGAFLVEFNKNKEVVSSYFTLSHYEP